MRSTLKAFLIAFALQIVLMLAYAFIKGSPMIDNGDERLLYMIIAGSLWTNLIFTVVFIPGKIATENLDTQKRKRIAYFLVPAVIFIILLLNLFHLQEGDYEFYLVGIISFILAHVYVLSRNNFVL